MINKTAGGDELCMSRTATSLGKRVLIIDDLVATGGTLIAACDLMRSVGFEVIACYSEFVEFNQTSTDCRMCMHG